MTGESIAAKNTPQKTFLEGKWRSILLCAGVGIVCLLPVPFVASSAVFMWVGLIVLVVAVLFFRSGSAALLGVSAATLTALPVVHAARLGGELLAGDWLRIGSYLFVWGATVAVAAHFWRSGRNLSRLFSGLLLIMLLGIRVALAEALDAVVYSSRYLTMRDGTRIAVDLYLPRNLREGERLPTILHQTRYYRAYDLRWPVSLFLSGISDSVGRFVNSRYAYVAVDVRGSGASFGTRQQEWSPDEVRDGAEIVEWIIHQPWSDGKVGATGISYEGTAAEFLLVNRHPAVKAIAVRFSLFDTYADIAFPGGIHHSRFTAMWEKGNEAMDRNEFGAYLGGLARFAFTGVRPVAEDRDGSLLRDAIKSHADNYDVHRSASQLTFRDDPNSFGHSIDDMSPHQLLREIEASGAAVYSYDGWYDGAYANAAIKRFNSLKGANKRLMLGPWNHAGSLNVSPFHPGQEIFDHDAELLRFFDYYLKGVDNGLGAEKPVRYYTIGEERWKSSDVWPPADSRLVRYYFDARGGLTTGSAPLEQGADTYQVDNTAGSGDHSRWNSLLYVDHVDELYPDWNKRQQKLLSYTSGPLQQDTEVTGQAIVTLLLSSSASDGNFFVYLEDVDENGKAGYVTEGILRGLHRKLGEAPPNQTAAPVHSFRRADAQPLVPGEVTQLAFELLPTSYLFKRGHSIRVALSGADQDHFASLPGAPPLLKVYHGGAMASFIDLPLVPVPANN